MQQRFSACLLDGQTGQRYFCFDFLQGVCLLLKGCDGSTWKFVLDNCTVYTAQVVCLPTYLIYDLMWHASVNLIVWWATKNIWWSLESPKAAGSVDFLHAWITFHRLCTDSSIQLCIFKNIEYTHKICCCFPIIPFPWINIDWYLWGFLFLFSLTWCWQKVDI